MLRHVRTHVRHFTKVGKCAACRRVILDRAFCESQIHKGLIKMRDPSLFQSARDGVRSIFIVAKAIVDFSALDVGITGGALGRLSPSSLIFAAMEI